MDDLEVQPDRKSMRLDARLMQPNRQPDVGLNIEALKGPVTISRAKKTREDLHQMITIVLSSIAVEDHKESSIIQCMFITDEL
ncbi:antibiotic biosynthesis monooxygenase [Sesbania bispinosa]|nr:antibiotic biosynthesis monooxygenase [Sesbania bispinosa]